MFVSSYSTYINTNSTERAQNEKKTSKESSSLFETKLNSLAKNNSQAFLAGKTQLPVTFISDYKVMNNQQKLEQELDTNSLTQQTKFTKINNLNSAKSAYAENSVMFSKFMKTKISLDQTPTLDKKMPPESKEAQEIVLKHKMINTYIANENYYKITA